MLKIINRYLYCILVYLISLTIPIYLKQRGRKNPEYLLHWHERFGFNLKNMSNKPIIWLHAVSVGETRAMLKIVEILQDKYPKYQLLLTQMTPTARSTAKSLYKDVLLHYIPYDLPHAVINFYKIFKPRIGLIMETEIWPNLFHYAKHYNVPLFLVNARLSPKSFNAYKKIAFFIRPILNNLSGILSQDILTQQNFTALGYTQFSQVIGNTKFDINLDNNMLDTALSIKQLIPHKKIVIFASTRNGEEQHIISYIKNLSYLVIIVPRHPERFTDVEKMLKQNSLRYIKRSDNELPTASTEVILGNSMGEMLMYYAMADIAVIGGSMNGLGGQNLIEPIFIGKPVIFGNSMFNFTEIANNAIKSKCAIQVETVEECFSTINQIFSDSKLYNNLVKNCLSFSHMYQGASKKIIDTISPYIK